ncbi:MAG: hypothetical protein A3G52_01295 [Candidatus Taylorbacteria bacterium RIFCSPLOWO2_12_FULL_43_20]|uniref:General secretion pathway GspH domain-containing protein n=1 Tax=Candidatus Taylorbacteria bacterium RIFCSPLOWO2_12_FULL_43_20 TaxID=1802332 RepID=A0A1G2P5M5_9BACT|nr:MAG: hypothetical protein A2825_01290 [Candidatus Taylorbacteria bacterium RIFCSPHIGHO2_01_FULL_43_120]OHA22327.1 MAG: hypothetical protein A3B98_04415 [Candidatus Taylorbacteria bacterium RIFCSPHIGHO2_02_FULL_43_55]OHA39535.1 MAG: hypothetical protein A3H58_02675 [Candidatus Taylorbacteria bacterium RIFCSPLOWO2_02_FULL_43_22b]OHA42871.1 MAG: hypothetical protein A3G52_01295 [Candidatus Taylorbacteria bacterium RIFCSPLOWO2_12_FULL_43_20]
MKSSPAVTSGRCGFTLMELVVTVCVMAILFAAGASISSESYRRHAFTTERDKVIQLLFKARADAMGGVNGKAHGLRIAGSRYVIFEGDVFDPSASENINFDKSGYVTVSGVSEIVFESLSGSVESPGEIFFSNGSEIKKVTIGDEGEINW